MSFIQIIECTKLDFDAYRKIDDEWQQATEGRRTVRREILTRDRNDPDRYVAVVFFDSYESAMENSNLPETQAAAEELAAAAEQIRFDDLDVIEDRS